MQGPQLSGRSTWDVAAVLQFFKGAGMLVLIVFALLGAIKMFYPDVRLKIGEGASALVASPAEADEVEAKFVNNESQPSFNDSAPARRTAGASGSNTGAGEEPLEEKSFRLQEPRGKDPMHQSGFFSPKKPWKIYYRNQPLVPCQFNGGDYSFEYDPPVNRIPAGASLTLVFPDDEMALNFNFPTSIFNMGADNTLIMYVMDYAREDTHVKKWVIRAGAAYGTLPMYIVPLEGTRKGAEKNIDLVDAVGHAMLHTARFGNYFIELY